MHCVLIAEIDKVAERCLLSSSSTLGLSVELSWNHHHGADSKVAVEQERTTTSETCGVLD